MFLDIDRVKAQALGVSVVGSIFNTLGATLGGSYINNFNLFGRVWQVNIEGEAQDRRDRLPTSTKSTCATRTNEMVPMASLAKSRIVARSAGHHPLQQLSRDLGAGLARGRGVVGDSVAD